MIVALLAPTGLRAQNPPPQQQAEEALGLARKTLAFVERSAPQPAFLLDMRAFERELEAARAEPSADWPGLTERIGQFKRRVLLAHPLLGFDSLVMVERDVLAATPGRAADYYDGQASMDQAFGHNARKGGGLFLLKHFKSDKPERMDLTHDLTVPTGTNRGQRLSDGAFMSPALSYDGKTLLCAWASGGSEKWKKENRFNLFRVNVDGTGLARLTDGDFDDFDPCWLPDGGIAFISTRRGGFGRCHPRPVPTYTLFAMNPDGTGIHCLSFHETNEWQPSVDHDGMLLYTRWDYIDRDAMIAIHPWTCYPDGSNPRAVHGNYPLPLETVTGSQWPDGRKLRPQCEHGLKAIPGSRNYVGVATPHHDQSYGSLILINPQVEDDHRMSQVTRLTPEVRFPEIEGGKLTYGTPWPLSEELYLCNYDNSLCVLYLADGRPVRESIYTGQSLRPISPIPVQARPKPPVIRARSNPLANAGQAGAESTLYVQNVYLTDSFGRLPAEVKIKSLRVVQVFPKTTPLEDQPRISHFTESLVRASLGTAPVEADGSVYCEVPAGKEIYFQLLDERGMAVQSMRSGTYLHAGEMLSCAGCHEAGGYVPDVRKRPVALERKASKLQSELLACAPELAPGETVGFYRLAKPVLDARCAGCHREQGKGPDMTYNSLTKYLAGFEGHWGTLYKAANSGGSRSVPGRCGARAAGLFAGGYLTGDSVTCPGRVKLDDKELRRITLWLDLNSNELGAYENEAAQKQGQRVAPAMD